MIFGKQKIKPVNMSLNTFNTLLSFIFAPSFILLLQFFSFFELTLAYAVVMFLYLLFSIYIKANIKTMATPLVYLVFIVIAYFFSSMESVKSIPALISGFFFFFFLESVFSKRHTILKFSQKFYKKELSTKEEEFIASSDAYWAAVTFLNVSIQVMLIFNENNNLWAFYSSLGWVLFLGSALVLQILYGKILVLRKDKEV